MDFLGRRQAVILLSVLAGVFLTSTILFATLYFVKSPSEPNGKAVKGCPQSDYNWDAGTIQSPDFPNSYGEDEDCDYRITVSLPRVRISFTVLDLAPGDHVDVFDGLEDDANLIESLTQVQLPHAIISQSGEARVEFHSGFSGGQEHGRGFQAYFLAESEIPTTDASTTTTITPPDCPAENYQGPSGVIRSPNYPDDYANGQHCDYRITVAQNRVVKLRFDDFSTEQRYDYVQLRDGRGQLIAKLSGDNIEPRVYYSNDNQLLAHFHSDGSNVKRGFSATYSEALDAPSTTTTTSMSTSTPSLLCPGERYSAPSGTIHSPDYPNHYGNNQDCDYKMSVQSNKAVRINFTSFNTESRYDYVDLFDGFDENSPLISRISGVDLDGSTYQSTANELWAHFHSDGSQVYTGFMAHFTTIESPTTTPTTPSTTTTPSSQCGGDFIFDSATNLCYRYDKRLLNWANARAACTALGAHLASVHDDGQNNFIAEYIMRETRHADRWFVWLGANKTGATFTWVDDTAMDYTSWLSGQPQDSNGHCVAMAAWQPIGWLAFNCDYGRPFVCIKQPNFRPQRH